MATVHRISVSGVKRELPIREVAAGVHIALFNPLGDHELNEALGKALASRVPAGTEVLIMPDGKAQALLHVLGRETGLPTLVARKEIKSYMKKPVIEGRRNECMTSAGGEAFYLGADDAARIKGFPVAIVDDVISTGGSIAAMKRILDVSGANLVATICCFTEGKIRDDVISLGHLPVNDEKWLNGESTSVQF